MSPTNGHNPHDAIAARIVAGAIAADKMPKAARNAVRRALTAAGMQPQPQSVDPAEGAQAQGQAAAALVDAMGNAAPPPAMVVPDEEVAALAKRIELHQDGVLDALVREQYPDAEPDAIAGALQGFDYPLSSKGPGFREWRLNGRPLVRFFSPEVAVDEGAILVDMRYMVLR